MTEEEKVDDMIEAHWSYIEATLSEYVGDRELRTIQYHYKTAFAHGYKHGKEARVVVPSGS